jgi:hypothetical protein
MRAEVEIQVQIFWDPYSNPDYYTVSAASVRSFENDQRGGDASGGFFESGWDANAGIENAGDGWYRVFNSVPAASAADAVTMSLYPAGWDSTDPIDGETSGGLYVYGFQCELGRWPTPVQFNSGYVATAWDLSGNVLSRVSGKYGYDKQPEDKGTVRVVPPLGTSSYVPTNYLSSPPNPDSTRVEEGDTFVSDLSCALSGLNVGQNLNFVPYRSYGASDLGTRQNCFSAYGDFRSAEGLQFSAYVPNYAWPFDGNVVSYNTLSPSGRGQGTLGNQAFYLGCYPEGSSTGGSRFAFVSSLDNSAAFPINYQVSSDPNFVSGTYNSIVNEASSMDVFGFVNMVMSGSPGTTTGYAMSSTASGLCVSGGADSTNSGIVEYSMLLGSGDVGYSNLYGGIYNMGLWTIDTEASRLAGNSPPYSFGPLDNPRKYKLFATKHLTKNLGFIEDNDTAAGAMNYTDLTIKWRIHFT